MSPVLKHPQAIMSAPLFQDILFVVTLHVTVIISHNLPDESCNVQGGSNTTRTVYTCLHTNQFRSYLNHLVYCISQIYNCLFFKTVFFMTPCSLVGQECPNPRHLVALVTKFCTVAPNICGFSVGNMVHVTLLAPTIWGGST